MLDDDIHPNGYWLMSDKVYRFDKGLARALHSFAGEQRVVDILDMGCGSGAYTFFLRRYGFDVDGYDGNPHTTNLTDGECGVMDFAEPVKLRPRDLFMSLEVAEHIPKEKEGVFLDNILSPQAQYIVISWAIEGQGGLGHVNCRNNNYVIDKFWSAGYALMEKETKRMRKASKISWFKKSIMVYERLGSSSSDV